MVPRVLAHLPTRKAQRHEYRAGAGADAFAIPAASRVKADERRSLSPDDQEGDVFIYAETDEFVVKRTTCGTTTVDCNQHNFYHGHKDRTQVLTKEQRVERARKASLKAKANGRQHRYTSEKARHGGLTGGRNLLLERGPDYFRALALKSHKTRAANKLPHHCENCQRTVSGGTKSCSMPRECEVLTKRMVADDVLKLGS
jgi:hypothetical protein